MSRKLSQASLAVGDALIAMHIYGHRGARAELPENTLAGFRRAAESGAEGIELDLRLSRDHRLMVIHDDTLQRTTGTRGKVANLDAADMARLDARSGLPPCVDAQPVPTIEQVLDACPEIGHFQLEAKSPHPRLFEATARSLATLFAARKLYARATLTSFDTELLKAVRALDPAIPLGLVSDRARPDPIATARSLGAGLLVLKWKLCSAARVSAAHAAGLRISAWTVNEESDVRRLHACAVDSVVTDCPSRMVPLARALAGAS